MASKIVGNTSVSSLEGKTPEARIMLQKPQTLDLNSLTPAIQIDLVPTRTPTPEEPEDTSWLEQQAQRALTRRKIRVKIIQEEDEEEQEHHETAKKNKEKHKHGQKTKYHPKEVVNGQISDTKFKEQTSFVRISETSSVEASANQSLSTEQIYDPELRELARNFVQNVIEKATNVAHSRIARETSRASELSSDAHGRRNLQPWFVRLRHLLSRLMRSACLCKSKMPTSSNTCSSLADHA